MLLQINEHWLTRNKSEVLVRGEVWPGMTRVEILRSTAPAAYPVGVTYTADSNTGVAIASDMDLMSRIEHG